MESDRKKEVLNTCLELFVSKGMSETSVRDLSNAINLQVSGMYYYFKSKDEAVIACAEEAALRVEVNLIGSALKDIDNPERMFKRLLSRADEMAPTMRFFTQVCSSPKYASAMEPVLDRLSERYKDYAVRFAIKTNCDVAVIVNLFYACISVMTDYMIFGKRSYLESQIKTIENKLKQILSNKTNTMDGSKGK